MPAKPWFRPINDDSDPTLHTWVFEVGDVRYQLEGPKKPPKKTIIPKIKPYAWETPAGLKQLDFKAFIKFIKHHQKEKEPSNPSKPIKKFDPFKKKRPPRLMPPSHPGWLDLEGNGGFGQEWLIYRRPEGYGKSSLVEEMVNQQRTVIFCSKSNKQLIEHEKNFKERWSNYKIYRHISKAQHLSEVVEAITGHEFKLSTHTSISPYAQELVDVQASLDRLVELVGDSAYSIFDTEYQNWKAPEIFGNDFNIILITLSAFQALCTGYRKTWWEHLNLSMKIYPSVDAKGNYTPFPELEIRQRGDMVDGEWIPNKKGTEVRYVPDPNDDGSRTVPVPHIVIVVDDPDRTDFDWMRRIDGEEEAAELYSRKNTKGTKRAHIIANRWEDYFEQRQERATFGFGILRKTRRSRPMVVIFTTELVTAKFACQTYKNLKLQFDERRNLRRHSFTFDIGGETTTVEGEMVKSQHRFTFSDYSPISNETHCTLIYTNIVRKRNHAMLIPIILELKDRFPEQNLTFIANGLGCEWNLMNVKGINTLNQGASVIKLSALHPHAALNLMVHLKDEQPRDIILQLVADQANQAIGRNQGNRYSNYPCIVLCEPKYMGIEKLLRYKTTAWSSVYVQNKSILQYTLEETEFEKWLKYRLSMSGRWFATSNLAEEYVKDAPPEQQTIYWNWRSSLLKKGIKIGY